MIVELCIMRLGRTGALHGLAFCKSSATCIKLWDLLQEIEGISFLHDHLSHSLSSGYSFKLQYVPFRKYGPHGTLPRLKFTFLYTSSEMSSYYLFVKGWV